MVVSISWSYATVLLDRLLTSSVNNTDGHDRLELALRLLERLGEARIDGLPLIGVPFSVSCSCT